MKPPAPDNEAGRPEMGRRDLANLAMLADGTLPAARRAEAEDRIAALPGGPELLEKERLAVAALRGAAQTRAPASLRERIVADRARADRERGGRERGGREPHRRALLGGGLAAALAVLALALVLALPGGAPGSPSVSEAASLALRGSNSPPPPPAGAARRMMLARDVDEVYFPNWAGIGWKPAGERVDRLDGRLLDTVYYHGYGRWIAYTIVGGTALPEPHGGTLVSLNNTPLRSLGLGGRTVVTWRRHGHTCILSGAGVSDKVLLHLASGETATRA